MGGGEAATDCGDALATTAGEDAMSDLFETSRAQRRLADAARAAANARPGGGRLSAPFAGSPPRPARRRMSAALARILGVDPLTRLLETPLDESQRFGSFTVGPPNRAAFAAARRTAMQPSAPFNPLFIHGPSGEGVTHLLLALTQRRRRLFPKEKVLYLPTGALLAEYSEASRRDEEDSLLELFGPVDMLVLDDAHNLSAGAAAQKLFREMLEDLLERGGRLVVGSSRPPAMTELDRRLKRLLSSGRVIAVNPADEALRLAALKTTLAAARRRRPQARVEARALDFMAKEMETDVRFVLAALERLMAVAELAKRPATIATVKEELGDLLRASRRKMTLERIRRLLANP